MPVPAVELEVGDRTVRVTSPDKLYFPEVGITKLDMVEYVVAVGDGIFAALQDRPVTMERWPGGYRPDVKLSTRRTPMTTRSTRSGRRARACRTGWRR